MRRVMLVADIPLGLTGADHRAPAVELLFGGCRPTEREPLVELVIGDDPPPRPSRAPDVAYPEVQLWFDGDRLASFDRLGVGSVSEGGVVRAGGRGDDRSWRLVVQYALVHALGRHDRHSLHAAVLARDGVAVMALGDAGAGKSTLAFAGWSRGWQVLTDDIAWLGRDPTLGSGVRVAGFPKPLAVPGELMATPVPGARAMTGDPRGRWLLPFDAVTAAAGSELVGVIHLGHSPGAGRLLDAPSGPELLGVTLRSHPLAPSGRVVREFFPLAGAISRLPAVRLEHDVDPRVRAARAGALLDEAVVRFVAHARARAQ